MPVIDVTVNPQGETQIQTHGFVGTACQEATRALESALGLIRAEQLTAEFHQTSPAESPLVLRPDAGE